MEALTKFKNILLIDDDFICRFLGKVVIQKMCLTEHLILLEDAHQALSYIEENCMEADQVVAGQCPDVIFVDINMPSMTGLELLEQLNRLNQDIMTHTKVVMLTTSNFPSDMQMAQEYGVTAYICKPITEDKLNSVFSNWSDITREAS